MAGKENIVCSEARTTSSGDTEESHLEGTPVKNPKESASQKLITPVNPRKKGITPMNQSASELIHSTRVKNLEESKCPLPDELLHGTRVMKVEESKCPPTEHLIHGTRVMKVEKNKYTPAEHLIHSTRVMKVEKNKCTPYLIHGTRVKNLEESKCTPAEHLKEKETASQLLERTPVKSLKEKTPETLRLDDKNTSETLQLDDTPETLQLDDTSVKLGKENTSETLLQDDTPETLQLNDTSVKLGKENTSETLLQDDTPVKQAAAPLRPRCTDLLSSEEGRLNTPRKAKEFPATKIQKVRDLMNFEKHYKPRLLSLGPIHHDKEEYQLGEKYKLVWAFGFIEGCRKTMDNLYKKIEEKIEELRDCYEEEVTKKYDDTHLARLLFVDGCAILQFIYCAINKGKSKLGIINNSVDFVHRDLFLLENQLPYRLLKLLMSDNEKELRDSIKTYIQMHVMVPEGNLKEQRILRDEEPIHLLDLLRTALLGNPHEDSVIIRNRKRDQHRISRRNVQELKAAGIHLRRSSNSCLRDISFSQSLNLLGHLYIPPITLNRPMLLNLVAYEMCANFKNDFGVISYIAFLSSLINEAEDVRELRKAGIFYDLVGSEEEVATLFNKIIEMPFIPTNTGVEEKIEEYYGTMLSQMFRIYHGNFNSTSRGIFKLLVVVLGLIGIKYTTRMYPFIHAYFITCVLLVLSLSMSASLTQRVHSS